MSATAEKTAEKVTEKAPEKRKFRRINSGDELIELMEKHGTRGYALDFMRQQMPRDRRGKLTGSDIHSSEIIKALEEKHEQDVENEFHPAILIETVKKAKEIAKKGFWEPLYKFEPETISNRLASEEYDAEEVEVEPEVDEEEAPKPKKQKPRPRAQKQVPIKVELG